MSFSGYHDSGLFWDLVDRENERLAACRAERVITAETGKTAAERAGDTLAAAAAYAVHHGVKEQARRYLRRPAEMGAVDPLLPLASTRRMLAIAEHHLDIETRRHRRLMGFGGEVPLMNAKAVKIAARWLRRFERADAPAVAAE